MDSMQYSTIYALHETILHNSPLYGCLHFLSYSTIAEVFDLEITQERSKTIMF